MLPLLQGHDDCICSIAFSPDGFKIATASWDKTIQIWDVSTGAEMLPPLPMDPKLSLGLMIGIWNASTGIKMLPPL